MENLLNFPLLIKTPRSKLGNGKSLVITFFKLQDKKKKYTETVLLLPE